MTSVDPLAFQKFRYNTEKEYECAVCHDIIENNEYVVGHRFRGSLVHILHEYCWKGNYDQRHRDFVDSECCVCRHVFSFPLDSASFVAKHVAERHKVLLKNPLKDKYRLTHNQIKLCYLIINAKIDALENGRHDSLDWRLALLKLPDDSSFQTVINELCFDNVEEIPRVMRLFSHFSGREFNQDWKLKASIVYHLVVKNKLTTDQSDLCISVICDLYRNCKIAQLYSKIIAMPISSNFETIVRKICKNNTHLTKEILAIPQDRLCIVAKRISKLGMKWFQGAERPFLYELSFLDAQYYAFLNERYPQNIDDWSCRFDDSTVNCLSIYDLQFLKRALDTSPSLFKMIIEEECTRGTLSVRDFYYIKAIFELVPAENTGIAINWKEFISIGSATLRERYGLAMFIILWLSHKIDQKIDIDELRRSIISSQSS